MPQCTCGKVFRFGRRKSLRCPACHAQWQKERDGYWVIGVGIYAFVPKMKRRVKFQNAG